MPSSKAATLHQDELTELLDLEFPAPILISDHQPMADLNRHDRAAMAHYEKANNLKDEGDHAQASDHYGKALELAPTLSHAAYQQACNMELWGKHDEAWTWFQKAVELGFSDFPFCYLDDEIDAIRKHEGFTELMATVRERYREFARSRTPSPVVFPARSEHAELAPILLLLHGYGDDHENYFGEAEAWSDLGFTTVAVPATVPMGMGGFRWVETTLDLTHAQLQSIVNSKTLEGRGDKTQVYLFGFSQGAGHALQLSARHADLYAGVVGIGLGGKPWLVSKPAKAGKQRPSYAFLVWGEHEGTKAFTQHWEGLLEDASWRVRVRGHPGGHHFPDTWDEMRPDVARFLRGR